MYQKSQWSFGKAPLFLLIATFLLGISSCNDKKKVEESEKTEQVAEDRDSKILHEMNLKIDPTVEPVDPIPSVEDVFDELEEDYIPERVELGRVLFHDTRLSKDDTLSCASCHDPRYAGIDRAISSTGVNGSIGPINSPTVFNAVFNVDQFWDGRATDLKHQAGGPPLNPGEMNTTWEEVFSKISQDNRYFKMIQKAYPDREIKSWKDITSDDLLLAIADYERTLITPNAPFDKYLRGDENAVSQEVKEGYALFKSVGCTDCHYGKSIGGKTYQKLGNKKDYFSDGKIRHEVDLGRYNITKKVKDKHVFKVPNLRNIALTAPYFHDGSQKTLEEAVITMAKVQLDVDLTKAELTRIVAFLESLTGEYKGVPLDAYQNTESSPKWK